MTIASLDRPDIPAELDADPHHERRELDEALLLEIAGPESWRVCDGRVAPGHGRYLAFVERKGDLFEVMQLGDDFVWGVFPTMRSALTHIVQTNSDLVSARVTGELAWLW